MMLARRQTVGVWVGTLVLLVAGCGGAVRQAVRVSASVPTSSTTLESSTSVPAIATPGVLNNQVVVNKQYVLAPPLANDKTALTLAHFSPSNGSVAPDPTSRSFVFLARYTDRVADSSPSFAGDTFPYPEDDPHDRLVVVVLSYGINRLFLGGATGPIGGSAPQFKSTMLSTYDPVTGEALWGGSWPGTLPRISTSPANG